MNNLEYDPELAQLDAAAAAEETGVDNLCRIVPAPDVWVNRYNKKKKSARVPVDLWHNPFAVCIDKEVLWTLVPIYEPSYNDKPERHIWVAVSRETPMNYSPTKFEGGVDFYFCRDWTRVGDKWIDNHLIWDLEAEFLTYSSFQDCFWR